MKGEDFIMLKSNVQSSIDKLNAIAKELSTYIVERGEALQLIMVALVAKRNCFFLGKTGQAKSYAVKEFIKRIKGANYFETLMNKMMDTEELFGRLDLPSLVSGQQKILTAGKLPEAHINFLDEIFKSNEIILNSLLKVLNYEDITLEGNLMHLPTISTFSASNEIPNFKKEDQQILYPLYNRYHLKMVTNYIEDRGNFKKAIKAKRLANSNQSVTTITLQELQELNNEVKSITVPDKIDDLVWDICEEIKKKLNREVSDRKKLEYYPIVQAAAMLDGRDTVTCKDLMILKYYLWEYPEEIETINDIVERMSQNPIKDKVDNYKLMALEQVNEAIKVAKNSDMKLKAKAMRKAENELFQLHSYLMEAEKEAVTDDDKKLVQDAFIELDSAYQKLNNEFGYTYRPLSEEKERRGIV